MSLVLRVCLSVFRPLVLFSDILFKWVPAVMFSVIMRCRTIRASIDLPKSSRAGYCGRCLALVMEALGRPRRFEAPYGQCWDGHPWRTLYKGNKLSAATCGVSSDVTVRKRCSDCLRCGLFLPWWRLKSIVDCHLRAVLGKRAPLQEATSYVP